MAIVALVSGKGSPGCTTSALAMTFAWTVPVLLVEADPSGGDVVAGYLRGQAPAGRGLVQLAVAARHERLSDAFAGQLLDIGAGDDRESRLLLAGIVDPAQAATVAAIWGDLATHLAAPPPGEPERDVVTDCGRPGIAHFPWPLIAVADLIMVVVRPTLRGVSAAKPALGALRAGLPPDRHARIQLLVVAGGDYHRGEVARALDAPLLAMLPWRPAEAAALSDGTGRVSRSSALVRASRTVQAAIGEQSRVAAVLPHVGMPRVVRTDGLMAVASGTGILRAPSSGARR